MNQEPHSNKPSSEKLPTIQVSEISAAPLPSPKVLQEYDQLVPGTASRIINMTERQAHHRHIIEVKVVRARTVNSRLGLVFGLIIGLATLAAATITALNGSDLVGSIIGFSGLASLVGVFVYGSQQQRHERLERLKILNGDSPKTQA